MRVQVQEVIVQLMSHAALATWMEFRGETCATLASKTGMTRSAVGHLRSGFRTYCAPDNARKIEKALNVPPGSLFVPHVITVTRVSPAKRDKSQVA
jgi:hypothetical protein